VSARAESGECHAEHLGADQVEGINSIVVTCLTGGLFLDAKTAEALLARDLFAVVPDIDRKLPVASDFLPYHDIFTGDLLRGRAFCLEAESSDLTRG
jgi:hypothetical protein